MIIEVILLIMLYDKKSLFFKFFPSMCNRKDLYFFSRNHFETASELTYWHISGTKLHPWDDWDFQHMSTLFLARVCLSGTCIDVIREVQDQPRHEYFSAIALYSIAAIIIVITILKALEQLQHQLREESKRVLAAHRDDCHRLLFKLSFVNPLTLYLLHGKTLGFWQINIFMQYLKEELFRLIAGQKILCTAHQGYH